ncbi:unnamed protein product [Mycena citricolor]|uniref:NADH dehydrogenase [ubiquinone] 1 alpha subcomplex subunit 13 n=1 Tax=Mycena citricolor TaxID=2018698 RepID=A0AAD2GU50_9AGAR|nr:unnamed protein product [Mycena citricolor]CAK5275429.1 unnamed protein product [Mycena citricolor]
MSSLCGLVWPTGSGRHLRQLIVPPVRVGADEPGSGQLMFLRRRVNSIFRRELKREKAWARIHLVPLLAAEGDRAAYHQAQASAAFEAEIMKDVKGWVPGKSVYNNPQYKTPDI